MTKLEMCRAILNPKTRGQEYLCEQYAKNHDKQTITLIYERMLRRKAQEKEV